MMSEYRDIPPSIWAEVTRNPRLLTEMLQSIQPPDMDDEEWLDEIEPWDD